MAPRCGCGSSTTCSCRVIAGAGATVTGTGSASNPYIISAGAGCYPALMTNDAAIALRDASGLVIGCPVLISDGPTIGVPGHTSDTTILLWPVASDEFGQSAQINTTFSQSGGGWFGLYDIDQGKIFELHDLFGNIVRDSHNTGDIISNQFPWGFLGNVYENVIDAARTGSGGNLSLVDWVLAAESGAHITMNHISGSYPRDTVVDLGGFLGSSSFFTGNTIRDAQIAFNSDVTNGTLFTSNHVTGGFVINVDPDDITLGLTIDANDFFHHGDPNSVGFEDLTIFGEDSTISITGCRFDLSNSNAGMNLSPNGGGVIELRGSHFRGGLQFSHDGPMALSVVNCSLETGSHVLEGSGTVWLRDSTIDGPNGGGIRRQTATTADFFIVNSTIRNTTITQNTGATGDELRIEESLLNQGDVIQNAPGAIRLLQTQANDGTVHNTASTTRGLSMQGCDLFEHTVIQSRTVDSGTDTVSNSRIMTSTLTINGAGGDTGDSVLVGQLEMFASSSLTLPSPTAGCVGQVQIGPHSDMTVTSGGDIADSRIAGGALVTTGAFSHSSLIVDGSFAVTLTANNSNRLKNKGFSDTI